MIYLIIRRILRKYKYVFLDGMSVLQHFIDYIATKPRGRYFVVRLSDAEIQSIDAIFDHIRLRTMRRDSVHVLLVKDRQTGRFIFIVAVIQMASHIGSVSWILTCALVCGEVLFLILYFWGAVELILTFNCEAFIFLAFNHEYLQHLDLTNFIQSIVYCFRAIGSIVMRVMAVSQLLTEQLPYSSVKRLGGVLSLVSPRSTIDLLYV